MWGGGEALFDGKEGEETRNVCGGGAAFGVRLSSRPMVSSSFGPVVLLAHLSAIPSHSQPIARLPVVPVVS